jgi:hypothetical protein
MARTQATKYARIEGLREFLRDMGVAKQNIENAERVFGAIAAATVVSMAKQKAYTKQMKAAAQDLKVVGSGTVQYGGRPYSIGAEFGAIQWHQFQDWKGNQDDAGHFLWPSIREFRDEDMLDLWARTVWEQMKQSFAG